MIPQLVFRHSWVYEMHLKRPKGSRAVSPKVLRQRIVNYEQLWREIGSKILRELERVTSLRWQEREIICYIITTDTPRAFSDPLTLPAWRNMKFFVNTLTHELIHRLLTYGAPQRLLSQNWQTLMRRYRKYPRLVRTHIVVHAIHALVLKRLFDEKTLREEIRSRKNPSYVLAWKVAQGEGYENVVRMLTGRK